MKKITAGLCLAALVLSMLSCGETAETPDPQIGNNDNTGTTAANTPEEDERAPYAAIAPAVEDFGGYTYRMASQDNVKGKYPLFTADTQSGDTINDAIYQRNSAVADAYNINIAFVELEDTNETVKKLVLAGDDFCDVLFMFYSRHLIGLIRAGYMQDLSEMPEFSFNAPWWDKRSEGLKLCDKMFVIAGDISFYDELTEMCVTYNKQMYNELDFENPYNLVTEGRWTLDKLGTMARSAAKDLNGDGRMTFADQWGMLTEISSAWYFYLASGQSSVVVPGNSYQFTFGDQKFFDAFDKIFDFILDDTCVFPVDNGKFTDEISTEDCYSEASRVMQEGRALFRTGTFGDTLALRDMKADFGILPLPKIDEAQNGYYNMVSYMSRPVSIPVTVENTHRAALITDALSYESMFSLTPKFYSEFLGEKILRDEESLAMVDILFDSMVYDIDFWFDITGLPSKVTEMVKTGKYNLSSSAASLTKAAEKKITAILADVSALD